jgi:riboflavin kinase / FMN adenylyltransferase
MGIKISGIVVKGDGYGRKLGYPTANLDKKTKDMNAGVYSGTASFDDKFFRVGILINPDGKTEAHLLNFDGDLYGKILTLEFGKFIREYKKFDSEADLIAQIGKDLEKC